MPARSGVSFGSFTPKKPIRPRAIALGAKGRKSRAAHGAPELNPLKEAAVPLTSDQTKALEERWRAWQTKVAGNGTASVLEFICYEWLTKRKKMKPDVDFFYQSPMFGGRTIAGGTVVDFYFPARDLAWNPAGLQFHYTSPSDRAKDTLVKAMLAGRGILLIYLYEDDLMQRPEYTMEHALRGEQIQRI